MTGLWEQYVADCLRDSPYLRAFWRQNRGWYDAAVHKFFDQHLGGADADDAPLDSS